MVNVGDVDGDGGPPTAIAAPTSGAPMPLSGEHNATTFSGLALPDAHVLAAEYDRVRFERCTLTGARFEDCRFEDVVFSHCELTTARDAVLQGSASRSDARYSGMYRDAGAGMAASGR